MEGKATYLVDDMLEEYMGESGLNDSTSFNRFLHQGHRPPHTVQYHIHCLKYTMASTSQRELMLSI